MPASMENRKEYCRRWREAHPNYSKEWYKAHLDYSKEYSRRWYLEHKEQTLLYHKEYYKTHVEQNDLYYRKYREQVKIKVLTYYGNGKCACAVCGESRPACLSIDHIVGNGTKHRKELGISSGSSFYGWLISNNFPEGYQTLCMNCQFIKRNLNNENRKRYKKEAWRN